MFKKILIPLVLLLLLVLHSFSEGGLLLPSTSFAQTPEKHYEAIITQIQEEKELETDGRKHLYQKLQLQVTSTKDQERLIISENSTIPSANSVKYKIGDQVAVTSAQGPSGEEIYFISDFIRRTPLYYLFGLFLLLVIFIGRKRGLASILGMGISFLIIFKFLLPQILAGSNPILIAIITASLIIPLTFYLSHGINQKTTAAVIGTLITLIITGILASIFIEASRLSGFASEEAGFLQATKEGLINIKGLILAGIIIGVLGILDDITISQSAIVYQLKKTSPTLPFAQVYTKAMDIGRDHIASLVNTLILVYTGAALPLLLLFIDNPHPFTEIINYEMIAEEIIRTLIASIGLILAVPITTVIATLFAFKSDRI